MTRPNPSPPSWLPSTGGAELDLSGAQPKASAPSSSERGHHLLNHSSFKNSPLSGPCLGRSCVRNASCNTRSWYFAAARHPCGPQLTAASVPECRRMHTVELKDAVCSGDAMRRRAATLHDTISRIAGNHPKACLSDLLSSRSCCVCVADELRAFARRPSRKARWPRCHGAQRAASGSCVTPPTWRWRLWQRRGRRRRHLRERLASAKRRARARTAPPSPIHQRPATRMPTSTALPAH